MALFFPKSYFERLWPWTKNVERILLHEQPRQFIGSHLSFGSDYSGDHKTSRFRVYSYLIVDTDASPNWPRRRLEVRQKYLADGRRMAFKNLGDKQRQRALVPFLEATEEITGHLVSLVVTKQLGNMSIRAGHSGDLPAKLGFRTKWKQHSFEQMFRTAHMFAICTSLWSRPRMDITWITDQDDIVANEARLDDVQQFAARLVSHYSPHSMGAFAMNTTGVDGNDREFEDFVAVADLAAGMLSEISNQIAVSGALPPKAVTKTPETFSEKTNLISDWYFWPHSTLRRTCILIDKHGDNYFRSQKISMHHRQH